MSTWPCVKMVSVETAEHRVERALGRAVEIVEAGDALDAVVVEQQLEFLRELLVGVEGRDVERRELGVVEVDDAVGFAVARSP